MKSLYALKRYYKYMKPCHRKLSSLQHVRMMFTCDTKEFEPMYEGCNIVPFYSYSVRLIANKFKDNSTFYITHRYMYPHVPNYYK